MKKIIFIISFLAIQIAFSQEIKIHTPQNEKVTDNNLYASAGVEFKPEFPGGIEEFYKYIQKNFRSPNNKNFKGGKIFVQFIVERDGSIAEIKVRDIGYGTKEEAIRVFSNCPKWKPAEQNGQTVRCTYTIPITLGSN